MTSPAIVATIPRPRWSTECEPEQLAFQRIAPVAEGSEVYLSQHLQPVQTVTGIGFVFTDPTVWISVYDSGNRSVVFEAMTVAAADLLLRMLDANPARTFPVDTPGDVRAALHDVVDAFRQAG